MRHHFQINLNSSYFPLTQTGENDAPLQDNDEESKNEALAPTSEDKENELGSVMDVEEIVDEEEAEDMADEEEGEQKVDAKKDQLKPISDKFFYKEMAKIKEKSKSTGAGTLPPKKSASAYIIFQKEVSKI